MKLPNRTGSICKLSGNRRRPYMVRIYTPSGYVILGYYRLRSEAMTALMQASVRSAPASSPTQLLSDVYHEWSERKYRDIGDVSIKAYQRAWQALKDCWSRPIRYLTVSEIEQSVMHSDPPPSGCDVVKVLLSQIYKYALAHDYTDRNLAPLVDIKKPSNPDKQIKRIPFDFGQVYDLMNSQNILDKIALIGCYTGMRPNELLALSVTEIDIENQMMHIAGSKTKNGLLRAVPIHPAILSTINDLWLKSRESGQKTLFQTKGKKVTYTVYRHKLQKIGHTPHDTRHTFATYARKSGMDQLAIKRILGHSSKDLTEAVYTHTDDSYLKREMQKFVII